MHERILIAEDDFDIANLIRIYLEKNGYTVYLADNGIKALEILEKQAVELAILDVMMPKMDGFELTRKIRSTSSIPLIILSAKGKEEDRIRGLETRRRCLYDQTFSAGRFGGPGTSQFAPVS